MSIIEIELMKIKAELKNKDIATDYEKLQSLQNKQNKLEIEYLELIEREEELAAYQN